MASRLILLERQFKFGPTINELKWNSKHVINSEIGKQLNK